MVSVLPVRLDTQLRKIFERVGLSPMTANRYTAAIWLALASDHNTAHHVARVDVSQQVPEVTSQPAVQEPGQWQPHASLHQITHPMPSGK